MNKQNTFNPMDELENKTTEELQAYNEVLEQSSEYQRILPKVMNICLIILNVQQMC